MLLSKRITPTQFLLLAVAGALLVAPRWAGADDCKSDTPSCGPHALAPSFVSVADAVSGIKSGTLGQSGMNASAGTWSQLFPSGGPPSRRTGHSAIYDTLAQRMIIFGGRTQPLIWNNDAWQLALGTSPAWTLIAPAGTVPVVRDNHSAIYDPVRNRMLVFGGYTGRPNGAQFLNDVWALSLTGTPTWEQLTPVGTPPSPRRGHSAIYDTANGQMVIFGGEDGNVDYDDVWALSLTGTPTWTQIVPPGTTPSGRSFHTAVYDATRERMIVFGGFVGEDGYTTSDEVWGLSLSGSPAWNLLTPAGPGPVRRGGHGMVYDEINDHVIMSTGITYNCVGCSPLWLNDAWVLVVGDMTSWSQVGPSSSAPGPRDIASLVFDSQRQRSVLFGGWNGSTDLNDVWVLNLTAVCGNGTCEVGETCTSCPADCGVCPQCDAFPCGRGGTERFVCHNPPGTAPRGITICIGADAVSAHLSHADYCGPCR